MKKNIIITVLIILGAAAALAGTFYLFKIKDRALQNNENAALQNNADKNKEQPPQKICKKTGCSGEICSDKDIVSACAFKPEFECYKNAVCGLQESGECGFEMTDEVKNCLEKTKSEKSLNNNQNNNGVITVIKTNFGDITLRLFDKDAPNTVQNFIKLSKSGFYNGVKFHRIIKGFMIQAGDPNSKDNNWLDDGIGGPGYVFKDEINPRKIVKGVIAMANAGPNTNGSQFFILTGDAAPWLDGRHAVFGEVEKGMDTVIKIENVETDKSKNDHPIEDVIIKNVEIIN